ncbi:guanyl-specific ribonuclease Sa [Allocatelliglobosispora scoriae]|uniref:Guanyl-specific ribonuclease Sa n=2 Tax=Allocatelliglobosispora scoriae TaxID=643052 RepID=A0A841C5N4_9ACTN|nr:guanyl-specific ribonuclease Sa [Allocatelliglobosispora scoriae]
MTVTPRRASAPSWTLRMLLVAVTLVAAVVAPVAAAPASAAVYSSCTISRCADARAAQAGWSAKGYPTTSGWYAWSGGKYNYTGGRFYNREGQLPAGATYYEYDVYARTKGAARDAYRIVVNRSTGVTWFSPNHYTDFYRL